MLKIDVALEERSYPVIIDSGLLQHADHWRSYLPGQKTLVISNDTVAPLYLETLLDSLHGLPVETLILDDGESSKTVANWTIIIDRLIEMKAGRDVCLIALGGGVIGDITGFAAATYMRGVPFLQVPTTLLAQVDASVGGKTAVNHPLGKNLIGAFHQPLAVLIDTDTLNTLPDREFRAGIAEVIKYGVIGDMEFFEWLESNTGQILAREPNLLATLIERSVRNKARVVAEDELESGARALLNFGHTFGHALETVTGYSKFRHGEAVAIGMVIAARLSESRGLCPGGVASRISRLLTKLKLPTTLPDDVRSENLMQAMALDKKNLAGQTRLVLLQNLGNAIIDSQSSTRQIEAALAQSR